MDKYKVVQLGDERDPITGIVKHDDQGDQIIAMDVNEGYAAKIVAFLNSTSNPMPVPKVRNGAITGVIALLVIAVAEGNGIQVDAEMSSVITLVASVVAGYMTPPVG